MKWPLKLWLPVLCILVVAGFLRFWRLDNRPMHGDEAIHAYKLGQLLEENYYRYDPNDFHGPALNYFTLVPARLTFHDTYRALTESTLRIVPAFFGLLLVISPLLLADGFSKTTAIVAAAITAISPAFVFYSRYYIPEMLLVFFAFAVIVCGYRYAKSKKPVWALLTGLFAGLCGVTKETWIIALSSMLIALAIVLLARRRATLPNPRHLLLGIAAALIVWVLFYTSFFSNPAGLIDSVRCLATYFNAAASNPDKSGHFHPWYYYLKLLIYNKASMGPPWTEAFVVILAGVGGVLVITRKGMGALDKRLLDFLVFYTFFMLIIYSVLPYKTPWCLLSFYHGMVLLAAVGVVAIINLIRPVLARIVVSAFFLTAATDLCLQAHLAGFVSFADVSAPYVYSQPTKDVVKISKRIDEILPPDSTGGEEIWVVCPGADYWPLPWYLRRFKNVGFFHDVNEIIQPAPVVIAAAELEDRLIDRLYEISPAGQKNLYVPLFETYTELRPGAELRGYVTKDLADMLRESNNER